MEMEYWFESLKKEKQEEIWKAVEDNVYENIKSYVIAQLDDFDLEEAVEMFDIQDSDFVEDEETE